MNTPGQKLAQDIKVLVNDAEELIKATAQDASGTAVELRRRMQRAVDEVKPQLVKFETTVTEKATSAARLTDTYVHDQPWAAVGVSAAIGLIIGLLISRG
jgi:ElaB/YqjD/DUF883 family membrane-anchored ribosome-binding protein